jgi:hypothetical protein
MTKAVLRPFLVMIGVAALLWCAAMTIHLANADASTGIAPPGQGRSEAVPSNPNDPRIIIPIVT